MSTNVPNPFWLGDQFILDRVFNPLSWWSEYHYGKDAMDLRLRFSLLGYLLLTFSAVYSQSFIFLLFILVVSSLFWFGREFPRQRWLKNNKTGKNIARVKNFSSRMFDMSLLVFVCIPTPTYNWTELIFWVNVLAFICLMFACSYLDATDTLPLGYHERKTAFQTT